nr:zinc finger MYM-type protein 1-like [Tanacetum cinerariifolium]
MKLDANTSDLDLINSTKDDAYCLPCYVFNKKTVGRAGSDRFTKHGFNKWKRVNYCNECAFITHVGNLLELVKLIASCNKNVENVVLGKAPQNAKYTSSDAQKEFLRIIAKSIQQEIRDEIRNAKFCLIVDESRDESKKEQMAIVVRFVDWKGNIKERFLDLIHETAFVLNFNEIHLL